MTNTVIKELTMSVLEEDLATLKINTKLFFISKNISI